MRFLGVDLAWRPDRPSGVAVLAGRAFPLHLDADPRLLPDHAAVVAWIARQAARSPVAVGIDAPLLGTERPGRRPCDDAVARAFGRFHAATHTPPATPHLRAFTAALLARYGPASFRPGVPPARGRPAIREVYPNALRVWLLRLRRGEVLRPYKRRRFRSVSAWAEEGLRPFVRACRRALAGRLVLGDDPAWRRLVAADPGPGLSGAALKALEDRWDAVLCAVAVALERLAPGVVRPFTGSSGGSWRRGYILAPALQARAPVRSHPGGAAARPGSVRPPPGGAER